MNKQRIKPNWLLGGGLLIGLILISVCRHRFKPDGVAPFVPPTGTPLIMMTLIAEYPPATPTAITEATPTSSVPTRSPEEMPIWPTFTPTPTQTPIAPNAIQGTVSMVTSSGVEYEAVVAGTGEVRLAYIPSEDDIRIGQTGLIWREGEAPGWQIDRALLEFDTSDLKERPEEVVLRFRMIVKTPGVAVPQAIHRGTWSGVAADVHPEDLWQAYEPRPLTTFLEDDETGIDPPVTLEKSVRVILPPEALAIGGITRLLVRTTLEGEAPPVRMLNCETCRQIVVYDDVSLLINRSTTHG